MFIAPRKFSTECTAKSTGRIIFNRIYEAIDRNEAEARAFLNCKKEYNDSTDVSISVVQM